MADQAATEVSPGPPVPETDRRLVPARRVVTGHDEQGRSIVVSDEEAEHTLTFPTVFDYGHTELWRTTVPADNTTMGVPLDSPKMAPPEGGVAFRITQFPPDELFLASFDRDEMFGGVSDGADHIRDGEVSNATMHRTRSVDFAVVVRGEVWALLDTGEVRLGVGDTLIQRGTVHGWSNRTDSYALVAFVIVDALPLDD